MDRCRCTDYSEAVRKLKINTPGTAKPDYIESFFKEHGSKYNVKWIKKGVSTENVTFERPMVRYTESHTQREAVSLTPETVKIKDMWCPYMTPVVRSND